MAPVSEDPWRAVTRRWRETRLYYRFLRRVAALAMKAVVRQNAAKTAVDIWPYVLLALLLGGVGGAIGGALWGNVGLMLCAGAVAVLFSVTAAVVYTPVAVWKRQRENIAKLRSEAVAARNEGDENREDWIKEQKKGQEHLERITRQNTEIGTLRRRVAALDEAEKRIEELSLERRKERERVPTSDELLHVYQSKCDALNEDIERVEDAADMEMTMALHARIESLLKSHLINPSRKEWTRRWEDVSTRGLALAVAVDPPLPGPSLRLFRRFLEDHRKLVSAPEMKHSPRTG